MKKTLLTFVSIVCFYCLAFRMGYELIKKYPADAVKLFKLDIELYTKSANLYDSLGEGYMDMGDTKKAIKNYNISLKLNPKNTNAKDMIKKMESAKP